MATPSAKQLSALATYVRSLILRATTAAGSGHPTSSLSATDLMTALLFGGIFRADLGRPRYANNDRLVFSKGHAAPLLYALYAAAGKMSERELLKLRTFGSALEGHPMPGFPFTEAPTGSLGQGLSIGLGIALAGRMQRLSHRTYVLLGDSEMAEGSVWEAMALAAHNRMDTLTAILDVNRLGQSGPTMLGHNVGAYGERARSFGWHTVQVDGHDIPALLSAFRKAKALRGRPTMIIAKTIKGRGVPFLENKSGWHGRAVPKDRLQEALEAIGPVQKMRGRVATPARGQPRLPKKKSVMLPIRPKGRDVAVREALGIALVRSAHRFPNLTVLDGEVMNSTYTEDFAKQFPGRFIQGFIAEQNLAGMMAGLASRGMLPVGATFAAFWARAHDQIRMNAYAGTHQVYIGTHVGVSIGQDGASQMGLEDIAQFRALDGSTVLYPSDPFASERLMELSLLHTGIVYLRATRAAYPALYNRKTVFHIGGSQTLRSSSNDRATVVAAGATLFEALKAAEALAEDAINIRVIDLYSIKPIDRAALIKAARQTKRIIVVEDHRPEGGMADAVRAALGVHAGLVSSLAVTKTPRSGKPEQLLRHQGIDAAAIIRAVTTKR